MNTVTHANLATKINDAHRAALQAAQDALVAAREAGRLLMEVKAGLGHGEWGAWLEANVEFSARSAQGYMRIAERWEELNPQRVAHLSLRGALALLSAPKEEGEAKVDEPTSAPGWLPPPGQMAIGTAPGFDLWIVPDAENDGFYFYSLLKGSEVVGGASSLHGDYLSIAVDGLDGFPLHVAEWRPSLLLVRGPGGRVAAPEGVVGWTYNELLFGSHGDYIQRHVLGRTLLRMERAIERGRDAAPVVRGALSEIKEHKLYRETHGTFEGYLADRWPDVEPLLDAIEGRA